MGVVSLDSDEGCGSESNKMGKPEVFLGCVLPPSGIYLETIVRVVSVTILTR